LVYFADKKVLIGFLAGYENFLYENVRSECENGSEYMWNFFTDLQKIPTDYSTLQF
jgi:hypothetical protein